METIVASFLNRFQNLPIFGFLSKKKRRQEKKEKVEHLARLNVEAFTKKLPCSSTPISSIPEVNFFTMCDISKIPAYQEQLSISFLNKTLSFNDFSIQKIERSIRLERLASLVRELRLENLYEESEDWTSDDYLDSGISFDGEVTVYI